MDVIRLVRILVGKPRDLGGDGAPTWRSGICKEPVDGPVWLGKTNLSGDGQADLKHHGGSDKAVLAYAEAHYPRWQKELGLPRFFHGATGKISSSPIKPKNRCVSGTPAASAGRWCRCPNPDNPAGNRPDVGASRTWP